MGEKRGILLISLTLLVSLLLLFPSVAALEKDSVVVINSKDWKDRYLATIYSGLIDYNIIHFDSLADAQLQTSLLENKNEIIILESNSQSVVKKYSSYLDVNGLKNYEVVTFDTYLDLQEELWSEFDFDGYIILDTQFGVEAITSSPLVFLHNYGPYFLTEENKNEIRSLIKKESPSDVIIAGRFPIRLIQDLEGKYVIDSTEENGHALTKLAYEQGNYDWGLITRIDEVDLSTLTQRLPIFLYTGDVDRVANSVKESGIGNFEVIDASMADIARGIRSTSGRNIGLMLKYARTFANVQGMEGQVLTLDTVRFDFPYPSLKLLNTYFYPSMNVVALEFHNDGNIPVSLFSSVEFAGTSVIDDDIHTINVGDKVTIPYEFDNVGNDLSRATITTQYGESIPLSKNILSPEGTPIIYADVTEQSGSDTSQLEIVKAAYNDGIGSFYITVDNPNDYPLEVRAEVVLNSTSVLSSTPTTAKPGKTVLKVLTPYLLAKDITYAPRDFTVYFGKESTLLVTSKVLEIEEVSSGLFTGAFLSNLGSGSMNILFLVVIILLVVFIIFRRKRKKKNGGQSNQGNQGNGHGGFAQHEQQHHQQPSQSHHQPSSEPSSYGQGQPQQNSDQQYNNQEFRY